MLRRFRTQTIALSISGIIISVLIFLALFGSFVAPNSPTHGLIQNRLKPPVWEDRGSWKFPLGTDSVGRCILSRIIIGTKYVLGISIVSIVVSTLLGVGLGLLAGYLGGTTDALAMRFVDLTLAFPLILLGILMAMTFGQSAFTLIAFLVLVQTARFARQVRAEALTLKKADFVAHARIAGCSHKRILFHHLLPSVSNTVLVLMTLQVGWAIMAESSLSFLGAGIPPPAPGWGLMVADGKEYIASAWWVSLIPGAAIMLTVLAFNNLGDWLRDRLDPRLRQL